jgi:hypothetical protein
LPLRENYPRAAAVAFSAVTNGSFRGSAFRIGRERGT